MFQSINIEIINSRDIQLKFQFTNNKNYLLNNPTVDKSEN